MKSSHRPASEKTVAALAGAVSTGLGVASMIVQTVHDLVRDAIADVGSQP